MEISVNLVCECAQNFLALSSEHTTIPTCEVNYIKNFLSLKEYKSENVGKLFDHLSRKITDANLTIPICLSFEPFILPLITLKMGTKLEKSAFCGSSYVTECITLAKLVQISDDAKGYAKMYFKNRLPPFLALMPDVASQKAKRMKSDLDTKGLIRCCYQLLSSDPVYYRDLWDWSPFVRTFFTESGTPRDGIDQIYCNHIIGMLTNMTSMQVHQLNSSLDCKDLVQFDCEQQKPFPINKSSNSTIKIKKNEIVSWNMPDNLIVSFEGVYLPVFNQSNSRFYLHSDGAHDKIVRVDSTKVNVRSIAMGIASGKAICLAGSVGSGKTTLIEYMARRTGRIAPKTKELREHNSTNNITKSKSSENGEKEINDIFDSFEEMIARDRHCNGFLRIQLGDQTDSKMLLGQYRCTDIPGKFIWSPGVLTEAVMNGYWLLLEDLDSATQDTYTILSSLLENNFVSVPGFNDCVKVSPGFQLFVTVRTNKSASSASQRTLLSLLDKYLYTINILPLSRNELCRVVSENYPKLATVANRIVDVFLTFSSGDHRSADNLRQQETSDRADTTKDYVALPFEEVSLSSLSNSGRLVSTRDLIKLCKRSNPTFSVTNTECAYFTFQNAVDIFCSHLPDGPERTKLITSIGAKLGIIQSRCEYLAADYKPEVLVNSERIKVGRADLMAKEFIDDIEEIENDSTHAQKRRKITKHHEKSLLPPSKTTKSKVIFSFTRIASCLLERIAVCVSHSEPVLLVGETGVGKTSAVQYLAERTKHKLVVVNMNNQSDVSDLVGGYKPVDLTYVLTPLRVEFENLFRATFNEFRNASFLNSVATCYINGNYNTVLKLMMKVMDSVRRRAANNELQVAEKDLYPRWMALHTKVLKMFDQLSKSMNITFAFIPGSLVNCIRNGDWVLLDEINLASAETLECLSTILEPNGSIVLLERGDFTPVERHTDFRIFACMNPNTDIGKKDLPVGIRNRFTEFFVDELTSDKDLSLLIGDYLSSTGIQSDRVQNIVKLYKKLRSLSQLELNDGLGNRPVFSLRTLCRSLRVCAKNLCGSIERNLYESFSMSFLTQLDTASHKLVLQLIKSAMLRNADAVLNQGIPKPGENYLNFEGYWIQRGPKPLQECANYILTESVKENLRDLARIIAIGKLPILLQGPTSAGKTSLIDYVARRSGNHCLRINNHEHTDLQEYIGTYAADTTGKLSFREGVLVQAMRNGYWIILDELNLASTDILEALNRVLDDNRELFIPETQTVIKAHPNFMLFATQNPPGLYGGRKTLSRAFKNRFIELHFSDIPRNELEIILEKRCLIPGSYAKKMVSCMSDLQKNRKSASRSVFTLRDLFRWGNRYTYADKELLKNDKYDWNQHLIEEGYLVLSAKVRSTIEEEIIHEALKKNFRKVIDLNQLFDAQSANANSSPVTSDIIAAIKMFRERSDIVWTNNMTRMAVLTAKALQFDEPVLLVGPTGCGKTTVCQILASVHQVQLRILNCHMHTESADFLGGLRPCRQSGESMENETNNNSKKLFEWADGPLIYAMQEGSYFMADEISLAEDSVLERLNCILEPERTVLLAEKGGIADGSEENGISNEIIIQAKPGFQFLATMNPGGDFGKKELSPALRNRFTEIWCQPSESREDLIDITANFIMEQKQLNIQKDDSLAMATNLVDIVLYIRDNVEKFKFSIRDILALVNYIGCNYTINFTERIIYGLETIFLDALEMLPYESLDRIEALKNAIISHAISIIEKNHETDDIVSRVQKNRGNEIIYKNDNFGIKPFFIQTNRIDPENIQNNRNFLFDAPTTKKNLFRLLSALSLNKPILLEGPPGVGKTSTVESLAAAIGYHIVRINLCEHTDLADLFGTDLPAEDNVLNGDEKNTSQVGSFVWRDGPLLAALKSENTWILLDEINLAPQAVLEGLNAILDHRGEVYIPELNKSFVLSKQTRIFACQNPLKQGGGRKGLPQSFLNRFTKVYLRKLTTDDLLFVVDGKYKEYFESIRLEFIKLLQSFELNESNLFDIHHHFKLEKLKKISNGNSNIQNELLFDLSKRLVEFSEILDNGITTMEFGLRGGPFEINLRDIMRWCDLLVHPQTCFIMQKYNCDANELFHRNFNSFLLTLYERMKLVYYQRMRTEQDKQFIRNTFAKVFQCNAELLNEQSEDISLYWTSDSIYLNDIVVDRKSVTEVARSLKPNKLSPCLLSSQREILKNIIECIHMEKPILLCGSTDTGKTKLIDAVCMLSNQVCNTDTIDDSVTGSFQQIDLNRHLMELSKTVEFILITIVQEAITTSEYRSESIELLSQWSEYKHQNNTEYFPENATSATLSSELDAFQKHVRNLSNVIRTLMNCQSVQRANEEFPKQLQRTQKLLEILHAHTKTAESMNNGGSFEWVDSKIVKSLKSGQYILLEHVNLCSSAVLDRLNPVFEPNGKLLISEKGVSNDVCAEIVEKSENFRAFLTIDPKNGELSRAMRNRCIELTLEKNSYSIDDKRMLIYEQGVTNCFAINCILTIHDEIIQLTELNNYSISHLIQFAYLTESYRRIGYTLDNAIYVSGMDVYVYSANMDLLGYGLDFYQNKLREIIMEQIKLYKQTKSIDDTQDYLSNYILHTSQLDNLSMIKLQASPLKILLQDEKLTELQLTNLLNNFQSLNLIDIDKEKLIKYFIYMMYEASSMEDVELRWCYLKNLLNTNTNLQHLSKKLHDCITNYPNELLRIIGKDQLPWNHQLYPRIRDYTINLHSREEITRYLDCSLVTTLLLDDIPKADVDSTSLSSMNALNYSRKVLNSEITDKVKIIFIRNLSKVLDKWIASLWMELRNNRKSNIDMIQCIIGCLWLNRLIEASQWRIFKNNRVNMNVINTLALYIHWVQKYFIQKQPDIFDGADGSLMSLNLDEHFQNTEQPNNEERKLYSKNIVEFQSFYMNEQIIFNRWMREFDNLLTVIPHYGSFSPEMILRKFIAQDRDTTRQGKALLHSFMECAYDYKFKCIDLHGKNNKNLPEELKLQIQKFFAEIKEIDNAIPWNDDMNSLEEIVTNLRQFIRDEEEQENNEENSIVKPNAIKLNMLPLREYYLTKTLGSVLRMDEICETNDHYSENTMSLSASTFYLLSLLKSSKLKEFIKLWKPLLEYLNTEAGSNNFSELIDYLSGTYKNLNTFYELLLKMLLEQQQNNLAKRFSNNQILNETDMMESTYLYEGPELINTIIGLIFEKSGYLKPVPLNELNDWKMALQQMRQLLWHNSMLMANSYDIPMNNLLVAQQNTKKLLLEENFLNQLMKTDDRVLQKDENFRESFEKLIQTLADEYTRSQEILNTNFKHDSIKQQHILYHSSLLFALMGIVKLCLVYVPFIDPVVKARLKKQHNEDDINCFRTLTATYDMWRISMDYKSFGAKIYAMLNDQINVLQEKQKKFTQKTSIRPDECKYRELEKDIKHFLKINCNPQIMDELLRSANDYWNNLIDESSTSFVNLEAATNDTLKRIDLWINNSKQFCNHTLKQYQDYYQDFLQPLQCYINQLCFGLNGIKTAINQVKDSIIIRSSSSAKSCLRLNRNGNLHKILSNIIQFPTVDCLHIFNIQSSRKLSENRAPILSLLDNVKSSDYMYFGLLKAKLMELRSLMQITGDIMDHEFSELDFTLNICNQIWQNEEERRRKRQAEEASLYVNKTKCAEQDEELLELQEIEEVFPTSVQEDFGEFMMEDTLEKVMKLNVKEKSKKNADMIDNEGYAFIAKNFIKIIKSYTHVYYYQPSSSSAAADQMQLNVIDPFKQRMQIFVKLFENQRSKCNEWLSENIYNSFCFAIGIQQESLSELSFPQLRKNNYNFYKDSNITQVLSSIELLNRIEMVVLEQLELYPDHASLLDIKVVIERIRLLPSTSPVVRFNSGFQILRQKIAQWNEVAHKNNNLQAEEVEVAEYVQKWTKLELQFWRNCLNEVYEKIETNAYKYWFFIYNLIDEFLHDNDVDNSYTDIKFIEKRFADDEILDVDDLKDKKKINTTDIVRILRQFMESSCYGDFHIRMQLLHAFELYLHHVQSNNESSETTAKKFQIIASLHNIQINFQQFVGDVETTKRNIRAPIEKKLKEFVKIESYNKDLSYFSMRNNVARVHRNLNKFLREYQQQLQQKITPVFQPTDATVNDYNFENDKGKDLRYASRIKYYLADAKAFVAPQSLRDSHSLKDDGPTEDTLLGKVHKHFMTSRNVVKETVINATFPKLIIALDILISQQLERCTHLRSLTVDRSKERPKQVLEAKQILQQKRKGLTDLFKILNQLGVNYKTGLMELSLNTEFEDYNLPPFCIKTMLSFIKDRRISASILHLNENLDTYYAKSVFKMKLLQNIMLKPLSELGPPNIERIKGFAVDLFLLVQQQRHFLSKTTKNIFDLHNIIVNIKELEQMTHDQESSSLDNLEFGQSHESFDLLRHSLCRIRYVFEQFNMLLICIPSTESSENLVIKNAVNLLKNTPHYDGIMKLCGNVLQTCKSTLTEMEHTKTDFLSMKKFTHFEAIHEKLVLQINQIRECLKLSTIGDYLPLATPLTDLLDFITKTTMQRCNNSVEEEQTVEINQQDIHNEIENILHAIMMSLQKLYKKYPKDIANGGADNNDGKSLNKRSKDSKDDDDNEDDDTDLLEHHLKEHLHLQLKSDWKTLNMSSIIKKLSNVLLNLKYAAPSAKKLNCMQSLTRILPILEQYSLLGDYYLSQQLGSHKVSAKMLSVMLTVFVEIGTKGFCVPPDLLHDEEGEKKKDQMEGEGFGLEDGTGENDASDKIESEDQLDDAKRPEDRDKEESKEQNDCKEEKGIEMSDNFDAEMQDIEKPENEEDDSGESEKEEELDKEMGETEEGAEKLDDQIWGDDEEEKKEEDDKEMNEEKDGKGSKDEKDTHNDLDTKNDPANDTSEVENDQDQLDAANEGNDDKRKQQEKDIDDMKENEGDDDQVNPYHNELEEPPEPDEMDLDNLNNVDEENDNDEDQQNDENPFDIDKMKDNMEDKEDAGDSEGEEPQDGQNENEDNDTNSDESDGDDGRLGNEAKPEENENNEDQPDDEEEKNPEETEAQTRGLEPEKPEEDEEEDKKEADNEYQDEKPENYQQANDKSSKEDNMQSVPEVDNKSSADQTQSEQSNKDVKQEQKLDEQDTNEDKEGIGQAENDQNDEGHQGIAETKETVSREEHKKEVKSEEKRRQGRTNEERTLGEAEKNKLKQLKTIDKLKEQTENDDKNNELDEDQDMEAEEYQHVKDPKSNDKVTLDNATEEQTKQVQQLNDEEQKDDDDAELENTDELMDTNDETEPTPDDEKIDEMTAEKYDKKSEKPSKSEKTNERADAQREDMEIEGEIVPTMTVPRGNDTTAHCISELVLDKSAPAQESTTAETIEMRKLYQNQLTANKSVIPQHEDFEIWQTISNRMSQNARELCEQLRLILEPTKCTRLKGDYRTGRRINMKKIIPYIASQFRKDKIWLRRTKPAQRDYKITIAIDDSKSMDHNNSKTLTLEAISLVSQALTLLESGRLSIVSFGEKPQIILHHTEQFDGPKLVNSLNFAQNKTMIADLLNFVRTVNTEEGSMGATNGLFENLLLVLSDGRNIFSEGKIKVRNAIKLARMQRIFIVYIIIDNPENKTSILDVQTVEQILPPGKMKLIMKSYLETFPFPYYVIVRDLNQLPLVLSEAMRQWFELVNSEQ